MGMGSMWHHVRMYDDSEEQLPSVVGGIVSAAVVCRGVFTCILSRTSGKQEEKETCD